MNSSDDMLAGAWIPASTDPDGGGEVVLTDEHFHRPSRTTERLSAIEAEVDAIGGHGELVVEFTDHSRTLSGKPPLGS